MDRLQLNQRPAAPQTEAYLNPTATPNQTTLPPIPIPLEGFTIGSDPALSGLVLDDASVEKLHARLARQEDGSYRLADAGSVAGVWVNYTPVSQSGARLEHGDLVHIGRIGFRFTLRQPGATRKPVVITTPREDSLDDEDAL
jgi:predicted component of type VI protein secretion system